MPPERSCFATTHWSVVAAAGRDSTLEARAALGRLCETYWLLDRRLLMLAFGIVGSAGMQLAGLALLAASGLTVPGSRLLWGLFLGALGLAIGGGSSLAAMLRTYRHWSTPSATSARNPD